MTSGAGVDEKCGSEEAWNRVQKYRKKWIYEKNSKGRYGCRNTFWICTCCLCHYEFVIHSESDLKFSEENDIPVQPKYRIDQWRDRPGGFVFN